MPQHDPDDAHPAEIRGTPYDDHLLDRARAQWQFGDWDSLAKLDLDSLQNHPDRAKLALLAAASHFQANDTDGTRQLICLAQEWGVSNKLVSRILVAGVYNSLGRVAAAANDDQRTLQHFEEAIRLFAPTTDVALVGHARSVREMTEMGLLPQSSINIDRLRRKLQQTNNMSSHAEAHAKVLDMEVDFLRERIYSLKKQFDQAKVTNPVVGHFTNTSSNFSASVESSSLDSTAKTYYGLHGLDNKLEAYLHYDNGYFVELGANDGICQSNTFFFEKQRGWRGLLIEPILHNYLKCKANRSPENSYAYAACVSFSYVEPHVRLVYSNLMTTPLELESDLTDPRAHAESGKVYLTDGDEPIEIFAPAKTLTSLLDEAHAPHVIDLLSLDVEGAEIEVLKGIDHQRFRFKFLLIECRNVDSISAYLAGQGYSRVDKLSNHDYLFASRDLND